MQKRGTNLTMPGDGDRSELMGIAASSSAGNSSAATGDARAVYGRRLADRSAEAQRRARRAGWTSNLRLAVFAAGVAIAWLVFGTRSLPAAWLLPPVLTFAGLLFFHDRLLQRRDRAQRSVAFYQRGLDRLNDRWAGHGEAGERFREPRHPYAEDLDLYGEGSLFELLCTARTRAGEEILSRWLNAPATPLFGQQTRRRGGRGSPTTSAKDPVNSDFQSLSQPLKINSNQKQVVVTTVKTTRFSGENYVG